MISHRYRTIFVHIPKCAGTSVMDVLWPAPRRESDLWGGFIDRYHNKFQTGGLQHLMMRHIITECGADLVRRYFTFTIIRNPFDRLVSQYKFTMTRRRDLREFLGIDERCDFPTYLSAIERRAHVQWEPQHRFLVDEAGGLAIDRIIRFEHLARDLPVLLERVTGAPQPLLHVNANSDRRPYRSLYGHAERATVERLYARDLEQFDYAF